MRHCWLLTCPRSHLTRLGSAWGTLCVNRRRQNSWWNCSRSITLASDAMKAPLALASAAFLGTCSSCACTTLGGETPPAQGGIQIMGSLATPMGDVPAIMQLVFQQSRMFTKLVVPQIQFAGVLDIPAACRDWYAQCKLCSRPWRSHRYSSWLGGRRAVVVQRQGSSSRNAWLDSEHMFCVSCISLQRLFGRISRFPTGRGTLGS